MRIISEKVLVDFVRRHPDSKPSLEKWKETVKNLKLSNLKQIKDYFRSADVLSNNRIVFNISGNKYRLITGVHIAQPGKQDIVFTIWIGTHAEYDKIDANKI